jgi:multidrug efflux system membrane fusion protein
MTRPIVIAAVIVILAMGWIASGQFGESPLKSNLQQVALEKPKAAAPAVRVRVQTAESRITEIVLFGHTSADRTVEVRAETAGRVAAVDVQKGENVTKGNILARIVQGDRPARLAETTAWVEKAWVSYEASRKLEDRAFRSRTQLAADNAELESAQAALASIEIDIANTEIRAPFAGSVQRLLVEVGDYLKAGDAVATVIDLDPIIVVGQLVEGDVRSIQMGDSAQVRIGNGVEMVGRVRFVSRAAEATTRTFTVEVEVPNPNDILSVGLTAELRIPANKVMAHRVSPAVLTLSGEGAIGVKIVDANNEVEFIPVTIVADTTEGIWLVGLPEMITLITVGQEFVVVGEEVRPVFDLNLDPNTVQQQPRGLLPIAERGAS